MEQLALGLLPRPPPPQGSGGMHRAATTLKVWAEVAEEGSDYAFLRWSTNADPTGRHSGQLPGPDLGRVFGQGVKSNVLFFPLPENQEAPSVTQLSDLIMLLCKYF